MCGYVWVDPAPGIFCFSHTRGPLCSLNLSVGFLPSQRDLSFSSLSEFTVFLLVWHVSPPNCLICIIYTRMLMFSKHKKSCSEYQSMPFLLKDYTFWILDGSSPASLLPKKQSFLMLTLQTQFVSAQDGLFKYLVLLKRFKCFVSCNSTMCID